MEECTNNINKWSGCRGHTSALSLRYNLQKAKQIKRWAEYFKVILCLFLYKLKTFDLRNVHPAKIPFGLAWTPHAILKSELNRENVMVTELQLKPYHEENLIPIIGFGRFQTPLPILKSEKETVSRASTDGVGSFLFEQKKEQFWNASRLLAIRRFSPLRLSFRIKSSLRYLDDGSSKSNGPKDSGCIERKIKIRNPQNCWKMHEYIIIKIYDSISPCCHHFKSRHT